MNESGAPSYELGHDGTLTVWIDMAEVGQGKVNEEKQEGLDMFMSVDARRHTRCCSQAEYVSYRFTIDCNALSQMKCQI